MSGKWQMTDWINKCASLVKEEDLQAVVIVTVHKDGSVGVHTNGDTKKHKDVIGRWGQNVFQQIITAIPFTTVFGMGNGGEPQPLTEEEIKKLSGSGKEWKRFIEEG